MSRQDTPKPIVLLTLCATLFALAVAIRLVPEIPNFSAVGAFALFLGFLSGRWVIGAGFALAVMLVSDLVIGAYDWRVQAAVYAGLSLYALSGPMLSRLGKLSAFLGAFVAVLASGLGFFVISNFAVWLFADLYPHTLAGLAECFTLALPFHRTTLIGDLLWTGIVFGGWFAITARTGRTGAVSGEA